MSELGILEFDVRRPLGTEALQGHVEGALRLGLPEALAPARLDIIANGPSAVLAPLDELKTVMALNGALSYCLGLARWPTYWAACDPQAQVADFLSEAPYIQYLLASQCHPKVFDRLRNHDVKVFHIDDGATIPSGLPIARHGSSITLTALMMAPRLGYWDLHVWGWDCCVDPLGPIHAGDCSGLPIGMELRELEHRSEPDGPVLRSFLTTNTWAYEAQQAVFVVNELRHFGASVTIHGDGLVRHTLDFHASLPA